MKFFKKTDIIIIISILAISILSWIAYNLVASGKPAKAEIYFKSQLVKTVDLNTGEDKTFSIPQNDDVIFHLYADGSIRFEQSDCPDKVCINSGKLNSVGETAACLPNEIILKIVPLNGLGNKDPDIIS